MLAWGAILLLLAVTILLFVLGVSGGLTANPNLGWLFVFTVLGTVVGCLLVACREALRRAEREMTFVLDDTGLSRRRKGWPDVKIGFSEVETLREELRWLVIYSTEPRRKIAIPNDVAGFQVIRSELARHHPLSAKPRLPLKSLAFSAMSVLSWAAVLLFHDPRFVIPAGTIALISLAVGSHRLWAMLHQGPKRLLMWLSLSTVWVSAILLIYIRIVRF